MKLSEAFSASIISLTVSKTVETDTIWRGNNPSKWIHFFTNKFAYVRLTRTCLRLVFKNCKATKAYFLFLFSCPCNNSLINLSMFFDMPFFGIHWISLFSLGYMWCTLFILFTTVICSFFFALNVYSTFQQDISE